MDSMNFLIDGDTIEIAFICHCARINKNSITTKIYEIPDNIAKYVFSLNNFNSAMFVIFAHGKCIYTKGSN